MSLESKPLPSSVFAPTSATGRGIDSLDTRALYMFMLDNQLSMEP
jgi:hypothetical protein